MFRLNLMIFVKYILIIIINKKKFYIYLNSLNKEINNNK